MNKLPKHSPNSERWYNKTQVRLFWSNSGSHYIYAINQAEDYQLDIKSDQITESNKLVRNISRDGIYFFHIANWQDGDIGSTAHFKIKIDTTPPKSPKIFASTENLRVGDILRLGFKSADSLSGLQKNYYVSIDNNTGLPSSEQLYIPLSDKAKHLISVRVFDRAGNFSESRKYIEVR